MNHVFIHAEEIALPAWSKRAAAFCKKTLRKLSLDNCELSIVLCNDGYIRELNKRFRAKDEPTDILSFSQNSGGESAGGGETDLIGDMVISLDTLSANSRYFAVPEEEELKRLLIHGILHLSGETHAGLGPEEPMLIRQERILQELSEEKIF